LFDSSTLSCYREKEDEMKDLLEKLLAERFVPKVLNEITVAVDFPLKNESTKGIQGIFEVETLDYYVDPNDLQITNFQELKRSLSHAKSNKTRSVFEAQSAIKAAFPEIDPQRNLLAKVSFRLETRSLLEGVVRGKETVAWFANPRWINENTLASGAIQGFTAALETADPAKEIEEMHGPQFKPAEEEQIAAEAPARKTRRKTEVEGA